MIGCGDNGDGNCDGDDGNSKTDQNRDGNDIDDDDNDDDGDVDVDIDGDCNNNGSDVSEILSFVCTSQYHCTHLPRVGLSGHHIRQRHRLACAAIGW